MSTTAEAGSGKGSAVAAAALLAAAAAIYAALSQQALSGALADQALRQTRQLQQGVRWELESPDDLVGGRPRGEVAHWEWVEAGLQVRSLDGEFFLSLNLHGQRLDARVFRHLRLRLQSEVPARIALYFRPRLDGPIAAAEPWPVDAGWQTLEVDLGEVDWVLETGDPGRRVLWGGEEAAVADLRLHPALGGTTVVVDSIELMPAAAVLPRPVFAADANPERPLAPVFQLQPGWHWPARVLDLRDRLQRRYPGSALVIGGQDHPGRPVATPPAWPLAAAALGLLVPLLVTRHRLAPPLALAALALPAGWLLTRPLDDGSMPMLALLLAMIAAAGWQLRERPGWLGSMRAWRAAAAMAGIGLLPLAVIAALGGAGLPGTEAGVRALGYLPWAAVQQWVLAAVLLAALDRARLPGPLALAAAAGLFGLVHYPNLSLMAGTLVLGCLCLSHYRRHRALLPMVFIHALLGTLYLESLDPAWLRSGEIGVRFFQ